MNITLSLLSAIQDKKLSANKLITSKWVCSKSFGDFHGIKFDCKRRNKLRRTLFLSATRVCFKTYLIVSQRFFEADWRKTQNQRHEKEENAEPDFKHRINRFIVYIRVRWVVEKEFDERTLQAERWLSRSNYSMFRQKFITLCSCTSPLTFQIRSIVVNIDKITNH